MNQMKNLIRITDDANDVNGNSMFYDVIVSVCVGVRRIKLYFTKLNISKVENSIPTNYKSLS